MYSCRWEIAAMGTEVLEVTSDHFRKPDGPLNYAKKQVENNPSPPNI